MVVTASLVHESCLKCTGAGDTSTVGANWDCDFEANV